MICLMGASTLWVVLSTIVKWSMPLSGWKAVCWEPRVNSLFSASPHWYRPKDRPRRLTSASPLRSSPPQLHHLINTTSKFGSVLFQTVEEKKAFMGPLKKDQIANVRNRLCSWWHCNKNYFPVEKQNKKKYIANISSFIAFYSLQRVFKMEFFLDFYDFLLMMALIVVSQKSLPFFFF